MIINIMLRRVCHFFPYTESKQTCPTFAVDPMCLHETAISVHLLLHSLSYLYQSLVCRRTRAQVGKLLRARKPLLTDASCLRLVLALGLFKYV